MVGEMDFPAGNFGTVPAGVILLDSQHRIFAMMHGTRGKKKKKKKKEKEKEKGMKMIAIAIIFIGYGVGIFWGP